MNNRESHGTKPYRKDMDWSVCKQAEPTDEYGTPKEIANALFYYDKKIDEQEDDKNENKIHEEVLDNHNLGARTDGSEMSTENREPYPGTGRDSDNGEKPMQDMDGTINQWN